MKCDLIAEQDYVPTAIYYEDSDSLEYLRVSAPSLYRRIDPMLTMVLSLEDNSVIGFKLKGFKNFYLRMQRKTGNACPDFLEMVDVLQEVTSIMGEDLFEERQRNAYQHALEIASTDRVHVRDLPKIA